MPVDPPRGPASHRAIRRTVLHVFRGDRLVCAGNTGRLEALASAGGHRHTSWWWYHASRVRGDVLAVSPEPGALLSQALRYARLYGAQGYRAAWAGLSPGTLISGQDAM